MAFRDKAGAAQTVAAEHVLIAVGRLPKTEGIGLEKTRAKVERGFVHTGPHMETDEPHVYAIGDIVAGMPQLAHAASMEGITAVGKMVGKQCRRCSGRASQRYLLRAADRFNWSHRTGPPARPVHAVRIGKFPFLANSKATILGQHEGVRSRWLPKRSMERFWAST